MVEARRNSSEAEQQHDLFSGLLDASQNESDGGVALDDDELIGEHSRGSILHSLEASYPPS